GWSITPQNVIRSGTLTQVDVERHSFTTSSPLPIDGSLNGQPIAFSNPQYSRNSVYRIARVEADGANRRVFLDSTTILGKGQVESIAGDKTLLSSIPHEYTRSGSGVDGGSG